MSQDPLMGACANGVQELPLLPETRVMGGVLDFPVGPLNPLNPDTGRGREPAPGETLLPLSRGGWVGSLRVEPARPRDRAWMARALERAREAAVLGEVPVGAVVVREGRLLAEGGNRTLRESDPSAHAEVVALRRAGARMGTARLPGTTLYVTLEPCAQCAGTLVLARVDRLVYGAADPKTGMAGSLGNLVQDPRLNHRMSVTAGVLALPCGQLLRKFFRERRGR